MQYFLKTFLLFTFMFAPLQGTASEPELNQLYQQTLQPAYTALQNVKEAAAKRKTAYIVSGVAALFIFILFAKFFKLTGVIVALVMIAAGYLTLRNSAPNIVAYETLYKKKIISPITETEGFHYTDNKLSKEQLSHTHLFAPSIKVLQSDDIYQADNASFAYVHLLFSTKENAAVERFNQNVFDGFIVTISRSNHHEGIVVSEKLSQLVAKNNLVMQAFFADSTRSKKVQGWTLYGDINDTTLQQLIPLQNKAVAVSYTKDHIYIAYYHQTNPFAVSVFDHFTFDVAKHYHDKIKSLTAIIKIFH